MGIFDQTDTNTKKTYLTDCPQLIPCLITQTAAAWVAPFWLQEGRVRAVVVEFAVLLDAPAFASVDTAFIALSTRALLR